MIPAAENFRPFFIDAGGVRLRAARFDADRPAAICLLLNGQTEFIEKYFEVIDELRGRGLSLVTFDWRGQGGSDRLLPDPRKAHITDFTDYDRDLEAVLRQTVLPLSAQHGLPVIAMAHSMGGEILIRRLHDVQTEFAAAILCAPMLRINPRGSPWWVVEKVSAYLNREGPSTEFVWGMAKRDQLTLPFSLQIGIASQRSDLGLAGGGASHHCFDAKPWVRGSDPNPFAVFWRGPRSGVRHRRHPRVCPTRAYGDLCRNRGCRT
jgi:pimeloyl-ACP methyl ester carboxylesterase